MASYDFIIDLTTKLEKQNYDYLLITINKGKKESKVDVFFQLKNDETAMSMVEILGEIQENLVEQIEINTDPKNKKIDCLEDLEGLNE